MFVKCADSDTTRLSDPARRPPAARRQPAPAEARPSRAAVERAWTRALSQLLSQL